MLQRLLADRRGTIAVAFALSILPLLGLAGAAVDYGRATSVRPQILTAMDRTALATVTRTEQVGSEDYARTMLATLVGNLHEDVTITSVDPVVFTDAETGVRRVRITVQGSLRTRIVRVIGFDTIPFTLEAEAQTSSRLYEVVLVVDVTGSMKGGRINALRTSARTFVETLLPEGEASDIVRIAIVPYSATVNIGRGNAGWLAPAPGGLGAIARNRYVWHASEVPQNLCKGTGVSWTQGLCHIGTLSEWEGGGPCPGVQRGNTCWVADGWAGCVMERAGSPEELTDAPPASGAFAPYYWPSWTGAGAPSNRFNSYLPNDVDESWNTNAQSNDGRGPNLGCPKNAIVPFTDDRARLLGEIDRFEAWHRGGTFGHVGLLWGWRMLSARWDGLWGPDPWPNAPVDAQYQRIVVFMTDGVNGFYTGHAPSGDSDYTAYGRLSDSAEFDSRNHTALLNDRMHTICASLRGEGVEVFTVGFAVSDATTRTLLADCASSARHAFTSEVTTLVTHFEAIARDIYERRVSLTR
ncbi:pilus assembly protein TadG-related protein [Salinarimonas chemoclinalis]|uniref:pilus assembly protein TadG-related protein n=1 Tax=Salinarimonas chemoclinalis TaxID=3241599 RepID=UPI0035590673